MKFALCALLIVSTPLFAQTNTLRAGAAAVDITPTKFPMNMPGGFSANMAEKAHDPFHARALVLDDGKTTLAMVVVDNLGAGPDVLNEAKAIAAAKTGMKPENMLISSTHTHSGPSLNTRSEAAAAYYKVFVEGVAGSIIKAHAALQPAAVGTASHPLPDEVFNRRWYLKPGKMPLNPFGRMDTVKMNPGTSPDVIDRPAGPTDPDITIISVQGEKRKPLALFANYSLHYVGGAPDGQMSADYFGEFARVLPSRVRGDENFVAMMSNGTSGDINNIPFGVTRPPREPFEQIRLVAAKAADTAWFAHRKIEKHRNDVRLGMLQREITLKYRRPTAQDVIVAPVVIEEKPAEPIVVAKEKEETTELTKVTAPEIDGPKIITKIDLDAIDSSTRPKKSSKKVEEKPVEETPTPKKSAKKKTEETPAEPVAVTPPVVAPTPAPAAPEPDAPAVIENIQAEKLTGPKILGKIELPVDNDTRPKRGESEAQRKRKRIPIEKKGGGNPPAQGGQGQGGQPQQGQQGNRPPFQGGGNRPQGGGQQGGNRFNNNRNAPPQRADREIDAKEIQDKIKETQAKLSGGGGRGKSLKAKYRKQKRDELAEQRGNEGGEGGNKLQVTEFISVSELAGLMDVSFADIISKCMALGIMVSINQRLEADVIELVASEFNYEVEFIGVEDAAELEEDDEEDSEENQTPRAPIVTIMGHVDHGKTSLLDHIRNTNVIAGEAGGITQHIGAYEVTLKDGRNITFLDTPGHEAFTAMRARGAKVTDIAVIVVAADDAVMPQTKEAISHAQAANVPMIFAINKIDRDGANPEKIKEQLAGMNILVESWGGKYQSQEISAKQGLNIDLLMEKILLEADILELKANPDKVATGTVIEASLDKGRGYVATILVQNGTLRQGDMIVSGQYFGKAKAMYNERNQRTEVAPPSTPVLILGLNGAPQAGETFKIYSDESEAREKAYSRGQILREQGMRAKKHITLDEIGRRLALGNFKELNVIIKGDVDGSVEALSDSLQKLSTEEIVVKVIHKAVGAITESDVTLANASDAIIIGFNVRPSMQAARLAENESIQIKLYSIIYNAIEEIRSAMEGMLEPGVEEKILANVEIKETYKFDKATVAGCIVLDGKIARNNRIRLIRDGIVKYTGELGSLKRYKDDAKEVTTNMECGLTIRNYNDIQTGDIVEAFEEVEVKRTL